MKEQLKVKFCFKSGLNQKAFSFGKVVNVVALDERTDGSEYLMNAVETIHKIKKRNKNKDGEICTKGMVTVAMTDCSIEHCKNLVDDINGINILISVGAHRENKILKPRGVPIIMVDDKSIGHITVGFDDLDQYEIRRSECIDYYEYLKELGLLDFLEDDESESSW